MAEWLKAHAWKACKGATSSQVRILSLPPNFDRPEARSGSSGLKEIKIESLLSYFY